MASAVHKLAKRRAFNIDICTGGSPVQQIVQVQCRVLLLVGPCLCQKFTAIAYGWNEVRVVTLRNTILANCNYQMTVSQLLAMDLVLMLTNNRNTNKLTDCAVEEVIYRAWLDSQRCSLVCARAWGG